MLLAAATPAGAQLTSMAYGFPSVFQTGSTTAFSKDLVTAQNLESVNIDFGLAGLGGLGGFGGFPSISQTVEQSYYEEHTDFYQTTQTSAFNYPYASVGSVGLPGLAGFGLPGLC